MNLTNGIVFKRQVQHGSCVGDVGWAVAVVAADVWWVRVCLPMQQAS